MADGEAVPLTEDEGAGIDPETIVTDEAAGSDEGAAAPEEEFDIDFGDGAAPAQGERETGLVKHLREEIRKRDAIIAERPSPQKVELGPKPTLAGCDYDEERFEAELDTWKAREGEAKQQQTAAEQQSQKVRQEFEQREQAYVAQKAKLPFPPEVVEEREQVVRSTLNQVQMATITMVAEDSALTVQALGRRPDLLAAFSKTENPLKLAYELGKIDAKGLKVMPKRQVTAPEEIAQGSGSVSLGKVDKHLERLEREADASGDRSKVIAYKREQRLKAA